MASLEEDSNSWLLKAITMPEQKLAFFAGAGISVDSGLPQFEEFSRNLISSIGPKEWDPEEIRTICRRLRPEVLLQVIQQIHGDRTLDFFRWLESNSPNPNHYFLALALSKGHCVFTTNADTLIEQAGDRLGIQYNPIVNDDKYNALLDNSLDDKSKMDFKSRLFKLHGSIEHDENRLANYESIRFALDRVGLGLTKAQETTLSDCLRNYDFVFFGYSGNDHFSVQPILKEVVSSKIIYWFRFRMSPSHFDINSNIENFRKRRDELHKKAIDGAFAVDWEEPSVLEVLTNRDQAYLIEGNSSIAVKEIVNQLADTRDAPEALKLNAALQENPDDRGCLKSFTPPYWVKDIKDFKRHLCAAALLVRMRDLHSAMPHIEKAKRYAVTAEERAAIVSIRALTDSITRPTGKKLNTNDLRKSIDACREKGSLVPMVEACLELANLQRIARSFDPASKTLDEVEAALKQPEFEMAGMAYDKNRLMAQMLHYRGLVYGLGLRGEIEDKLKGLDYCDEASQHANRAGDISRRAAILNGRGLILFQLAEKANNQLKAAENVSNDQLDEKVDRRLQTAERSLNESLALYARIGDPRSSFQPLRNLLLVHLLLAERHQEHDCDRWYKEALHDCDRGQRYLNQVHADGMESGGDKIELDFRRAHILGKLEDRNKAISLFKEVLLHWEKKNDFHQQARIWQELLDLADNEVTIQECEYKLLDIVGVLLNSPDEHKRYSSDRIRLENHCQMLYDLSAAAHKTDDPDRILGIAHLAESGRRVAEKLSDKNLFRKFDALAQCYLGEEP